MWKASVKSDLYLRRIENESINVNVFHLLLFLPRRFAFDVVDQAAEETTGSHQSLRFKDTQFLLSWIAFDFLWFIRIFTRLLKW
jgi:hypothetical protein